MLMHFFKHTLMPLLIQLACMLSDVMLLAAIVFCTITWGVFGFIVAIMLALPGIDATGGFFYSWKPSTIKAFFTNWRLNLR